jgi:hypothetical protein
MRPVLWAPHLAACPLVMTNRASEDLRVEKLSLRVAHLSIYADENRLWADESSVTHLGDGDGTQVEMAGKPPEEAPKGRLVTAPRAPAPRGMRARSFGRPTALPVLGGSE